jgi:hypothetical protein
MTSFVGTCVGLRADDLDDFDDTARSVTYKTFLRHLGGKIVRELDKSFGVPLRRDWHVDFQVGRWRGKRAVCLMHSRIHHIWTIE